MNTPFIGRANQIAEIEQLVTAIANDQSTHHMLLVSGEAGIGKSRLLHELRERITPGWMVLEGACFEPYQAEPYAPIIDLLNRHTLDARIKQRISTFGAASSALTMLPGLARLFAAKEGNAPATDIAHNQHRILKALTDLFATLAAEGPLLITIEDLHWSDAATLVFLPLLAHTIADLPVLLVVTYRTDEINPPLAAMLAELDRRRLATEIALPRLTRVECAALLRHTRGMEALAATSFLNTLHELTDGNPFFIEEVIRAMRANSGETDLAGALPIPRSVQEVVRRRTTNLSMAARELLTLAAALGRRFDFAVLQHVTGRDETMLLSQLKELIATQLIVEESADQFAFHHALVGAAVYGDLLARERRTLHQRLGEALESLPGRAPAADLARHFLLAGSWERALHYATNAAQLTWRIYALRETLILQSQALEAAHHLPDVPRTSLLLARATTLSSMGDFDGALADLDAALADARTRGRPEDEWQALVGLGELWTARDYRRAGEYFVQTLRHARATEDPTLLARSLHRIGIWHMNEERPYSALAMHQEALSLYNEIADLYGQAESLERVGITRIFMGDLTGGIQSIEQACDYYRAQNDLISVNRTYGLSCLRVYASNEPLDTAALVPIAAPLQALLQMIREQGLRAQEAAFLQVLAAQLIWIGDHGQAQEYLTRSIAIGEELQYYEWFAYALAWQGALALDLSDPEAAVGWGERALVIAHTIGAPFVVREVAYHLIRSYTAAGAFPEAAATLDMALRLSGEQNEPSLMLRRVRLAGAELFLAQGAPANALAEVDNLITSAINPTGKIIPVLWHVRGEALAALNRREEARVTLEEALTAASAEGRRPLVLRLLTTLARLALVQRRRDDAVSLIEQAHTVIDELAATLHESTQRSTFRQRSVAALPSIPSVTPRQAMKQVFDGLTDRELDVSRLIARGYSNRQIAEALVLSERTVGAHVGHILIKLSLSSRLQIARWVIEKGIAP